MKKLYGFVLFAVLILVLKNPVYAYTEGYLEYEVSEASVTITGYFGSEEEVTVPAMIAGNPVNVIGAGAFSNTTVKTLYLPDTIMEIKPGAVGIGVSVIYNSNTDKPIAGGAGTEAETVPGTAGSESHESTDIAAGGTDNNLGESGSERTGDGAGSADSENEGLENSGSANGINAGESSGGTSGADESTGEGAMEEAEIQGGEWSDTEAYGNLETNRASEKGEDSESMDKNPASDAEPGWKTGIKIGIAVMIAMIIGVGVTVLVRYGNKKDRF